MGGDAGRLAPSEGRPTLERFGRERERSARLPWPEPRLEQARGPREALWGSACPLPAQEGPRKPGRCSLRRPPGRRPGPVAPGSPGSAPPRAAREVLWSEPSPCAARGSGSPSGAFDGVEVGPTWRRSFLDRGLRAAWAQLKGGLISRLGVQRKPRGWGGGAQRPALLRRLPGGRRAFGPEAREPLRGSVLAGRWGGLLGPPCKGAALPRRPTDCSGP